MASILNTLSKGAGSLVALGMTLIIGVIMIIMFATEGPAIITSIDSTASTTEIADMKTKIISAFEVLTAVVGIAIFVLIWKAFSGKKGKGIAG